MKKIVVFGGTFNPVHNGHIYLVNEILSILKPDKILIVPTNITARKESGSKDNALHRYNMCKLAFENQDKVLVSDIEIKRIGVSYTKDTLSDIKKMYNDAKLYFLVGADMFLDFRTWKEPQEILKLAVLCVFPRENISKKSLEKEKDYLAKSFGLKDVLFINCKKIDISSTAIRALIAKGQKADKLITNKVSVYIKENNLYERGENQNDK